MANAYKTTNWIASDPLVILKAKSSFAPAMNTEYNKDINKAFPVGNTFQIPFPYKFRERRGQMIQVRDVTARTTTVTMAEPVGIDFAWDDFQKAIDMEQDKATMRRRFSEPAGSKLATVLDMDLGYQLYMRCPNIVGVLGTDPTGASATVLAPYSLAETRMDEIGAPEGTQWAFITPSMAHQMRLGLSTNMNPAEDVTDMFRKGAMGMMYGAKHFSTVKLFRHTTGVVTTAASLTCSGNVANGATTVTINCTSGDTFKAGERVCFGSSHRVNPDTLVALGTGLSFQAVYIVQQDVTATTTTCTLALDRPIYGPTDPYQNCDALPLNNALMTRWPGTTITDGQSVTGTVGVRLTQQAMALVSKSLDNPTGSVELAKSQRDPNTGLELSVVAQFDINDRKTKTRMEYWPGYGTLYGDSGAVCILGA